MKQRVELTTHEILSAVFKFLEDNGTLLNGRHYTIVGPYFVYDKEGKATSYAFDLTNDGPMLISGSAGVAGSAGTTGQAGSLGSSGTSGNPGTSEELPNDPVVPPPDPPPTHGSIKEMLDKIMLRKKAKEPEEPKEPEGRSIELEKEDES